MGITWTELQKQLYTPDEIEESRRRVAAVEPDAAAGDSIASGIRKTRKKNSKRTRKIGFELILIGLRVILYSLA